MEGMKSIEAMYHRHSFIYRFLYSPVEIESRGKNTKLRFLLRIVRDAAQPTQKSPPSSKTPIFG